MMNIPSTTQCLEMMEEYGMYPNIREHSFMVARVSERILTGIAKTLPEETLPDHDLVLAGALLHDIAKSLCLHTSNSHTEEGARICKSHGYPEVAEIVGEHARIVSPRPELYQQGKYLAKEIVFYADKKVLHTEIVPLEKRLDYILEQYGNNDPIRHRRIRDTFAICAVIEESICTFAKQPINKLLNNLDKVPAPPSAHHSLKKPYT